MSSSVPVPSQVEPDGLAELIADARLIVLPQQPADLVAAELPRQSVVIPAESISLVQGYADYGG
jgi:hypothetical protein